MEHQRAKIYAANLYEELKQDTNNLTKTIERIKTVAGRLDTFCLLSAEKGTRKASNGMLYYYSSHSTWINFFSSSNTTIEELKGSGNLRIMKNNVSKKISEYSRELKEMESEYQLTRPEFAKIEELYFRIFDGYVSQPYRERGDISRDSVFGLNPLLINDDLKLMKEFTGWLKFEASVYLEQNKNFMLPIKETATALISLLEKEYHLK
ncbi:MAG TPA: hypothetical protein VFU29_19170 [Chitinophagaceae bacterium]|nr:hypothetical protein [Chitinophagaceae bacterium]